MDRYRPLWAAAVFAGVMAGYFGFTGREDPDADMPGTRVGPAVEDVRFVWGRAAWGAAIGGAFGYAAAKAGKA